MALAGASFAPLPLHAADPAPFDLPGPGLRISVSRGEVTLPIDRVPSLAEGDRLVIRADFPEDQRARFLLVSTFLQGATNPPPKDWIRTAEPWKKKEKDRQLDLVVPKGARQLVLFLVPATGGAAGAIADAVRGRPGESSAPARTSTRPRSTALASTASWRRSVRRRTATPNICAASRRRLRAACR
ncbi:hypothetical protein ACFSTI_21205 [Rhizorhabdus histidinilytica]